MATSSSLNVNNNSNQQLIGYKVEIDDTIPLQVTIEATETINDHVEYVLRVHRGYDTKYSWMVNKRYREFDILNNDLKPFNYDLKLPPKKYIGNMDKEFISNRQLALQEFLERILSNHVLSNTIYVKKFLNEQSYSENYRENAIEHVSMFLRSEFKWQINENLIEIGWRFRKQYMTVNNTDEKQKYLLSWCDYGPDKAIKDTDLTSILQQLSLIQHEHIQPIVKLHNSEYGVLFIQSYNEKGSLKDLIYGVNNKIQNSFLKKYSIQKQAKPLKIEQIKLWSKQILETLKFIYSKGFFYGHLHSGNILIDDNKIKLTDLHNSLVGLPFYYRQYVIEQRKTQNIELIDVYGFGHVLYEMCYGEPLNKSFKDDFQDCPIYEARHVLDSILSSSSNKNGLPTIAQLLEYPFFNQIKIDQSIVVNTFKFFTSNKYKDSFFKIREQIEKRINEEQKILFKFNKKTKAESRVLSDKEKQKRRKEQKAELRTQASLEFGTPPPTPTSPTPNGSVPINKTNQIHSSASSKSLSSSVTSNSSTLLSMSPVSPPPPPPAPPMPNGLSSPPPAPPPPPPPTQSNAPPKSNDRSQLLSSIEGFSKAGLKKAVTVDKSKPKIK